MKKKLILLCVIFFLHLPAQKKWTLQEAMDYAVLHNLQVFQSSNNKRLLDKDLEIAKRERLPYFASSIGNSASFGQGQDVFGNIQRNDNFNNNASINGSVLVYNNKRLQKAVKKSTLDVEAGQYDIEVIKNTVSLQVIQQYLSILLGKEILKISQNAYESARNIYNKTKITTEVGTTSQAVLAEADAALARENQNVKNAEIEIKRGLFQLAQLLQLPNYPDFEIEDMLTEDITSEYPARENSLDKAYACQPQIKAAEIRIKAAEIQTDVVKTAFWPTITMSASIGTFYFNSLVTDQVGTGIGGVPIRESTFFRQYKNNLGQQLALNASIPIFNKGITKLQVEQAKINTEVARLSLEQAKQEVKQNVQKAQFDAEMHYETYTAALQAEKSTNVALDLAQKSFDAGRTTIYDLTIARNNYINTLGNLAQAKYNYLFSLKILNFYIRNSSPTLIE